MKAAHRLRRIVLHCLLLAVSVLALWTGAGHAQVQLDATTHEIPLRPFIEALQDEDGRLAIGDLSQPEFSHLFRRPPGTGDLNFGYSSSIYWLRFTLHPDPAAARHWLLEIAYPSLDSVSLFTKRDGNFMRVDSGDLQRFAQRPFAHRNLVFPIELDPGSEHTVYLRIESAGSLTLPMTLWSPTALHANDQAYYSILAVYFGMLLALGSYNFLLYFSLREPAYLAYVAFISAFAIGQLSLFGLGNQFLWPEWPAWGNLALPIGFCLAALFGALFTQIFLGTRQIVPRFHRFIQVLQAAFLLTIILSLRHEAYRLASIATVVLGTTFAITVVVTGGICVARRRPGAGVFLLAWSLLLFSVAVSALRHLALLPTNLLTLHAMLIGSALEMLLLSFALADRIQVARHETEMAQAEVLRAKMSTMEALQQSERTLEQRVLRRTAELAEANERLRQSEAELRRLAHHDPLTGLPNRTLLFEELRRTIARGKRSGRTFGVLMVDLDGFKPINDGYGHAMGDRLLQILAPRLQELVRASDIVARLGGDEFVVVVESIVDEQHALTIGGKIITALSRPVDIEKHVLQVGASVGVALWPRDGDDSEHLLQSADQAMYRAKQAGRGCCRGSIDPSTASSTIEPL